MFVLLIITSILLLILSTILIYFYFSWNKHFSDLEKIVEILMKNPQIKEELGFSSPRDIRKRQSHFKIFSHLIRLELLYEQASKYIDLSELRKVVMGK